MSRSATSLLLTAALAGACATPPTTPAVSLDAETHTTAEDLVARIVDPALSARSNAEITYSYEWYVDGALITDLTDAVVPAERTAKEQTWEVIVTATDGAGVSNRTSDTTEIINSRPEVEVTVTNNTPISTESVSASVSYLDADGDPLEIEWTWFRNGSDIPEMQGPDLPADRMIRDQIWRVQVVAFDGTDYSYPAKSDVVVMNGRPQVESLEIGPLDPDTLQPLVAVVSATDPDLDPIGYRFVWLVDGEPRLGLSDAMVAADRTTRGQTWQAQVFAFDDELESDPVLSNVVTIENSVPTTPVVQIEDGPDVSSFSDMYCRVVAPSSDADRDPLTYTFTWFRDGVAWTGDTKTTQHAGDTIPWESTDEGEIWSCAASTTDGIASSGVAESDPITIIAILEYRLGVANLLNMSNDCGSGNRYGGSGSGGVWWEDTGSVTPSSITIEYQFGVNCGGPSSRTAYINGSVVGTAPSGSASMCTCTPTKYVQEVSFDSLSSYRPGERNEFTMQWLSSDGWSSNPDWKDGSDDIWAIVTVSY